MNQDRRTFLSVLASVGASAPFVGRLSALDQSFQSSLVDLEIDIRGGLTAEGLKDRYLLDANIIYLNHASIGTMPSAVQQARTDFSAICESNPHLYIWGGAWDTLLGEVRTKAARFLGTDSARVSITHNTTEGFNTLAHGLPLGPGDEILFSNLNHGGASIPWDNAARARGFSVRRFTVPIADIPTLSANDLVELHRAAIRRETRVLVFPHIDNIVGLRHPMKELTQMAKEMGVEFVAVDGAQAVGMIPVDVRTAGVDAYSASPHKWLQSPKGLGLFYTREGLDEHLAPMWVRYGIERWAGQPEVYEDYGTRNSPEVMALGSAMDFQDAIGEAEKATRYRRLWTRMKERTRANARLRWNSPDDWEGGSVLISVGFESPPAPNLARTLYEENGIVLRAFRSDGFNAFRISPNLMTTDQELDTLFDELDARL